MWARSLTDPDADGDTDGHCHTYGYTEHTDAHTNGYSEHSDTYPVESDTNTKCITERESEPKCESGLEGDQPVDPDASADGR